MKLILFSAFIVVLLGAQFAFAGGVKLGTAGAPELLIPMGARNVAIGGSNIANVQGVDAIYWNPAGLSRLSGAQASFTYMDYFADMSVSYIAIGAKVGSFGVIGLSLQSLDIGKIPVTTVDQPEGTGQELSTNFITFGATYSKALTDRIQFGLNAKIVSEKIGVMSAMAMAFDFGLQYVSPWGVDFGVTMRNYGSNLKYDGTGIEFDSGIPFANPNATTRKTKLDMASHELPTSLNMGVGYRYQLSEEHVVNISGLYGNNNFTLDEINTGIEYGYNSFFFLRGGYNVPLYPDDFPETVKDDYQYGFTAGFGLHLNVGNNLVSFDYAYRDMKTFDGNQYFQIGVSF